VRGFQWVPGVLGWFFSPYHIERQKGGFYFSRWPNRKKFFLELILMEVCLEGTKLPLARSLSMEPGANPNTILVAPYGKNLPDNVRIDYVYPPRDR
jgi:hypothetical protein